MRTSGRSMAFVLCLGACLALLFASVQTSARQTPAPAAATSSDTRTTDPTRPRQSPASPAITSGFDRRVALDAADVAAPGENRGTVGARHREAARRLDAAGRAGRGPMWPPTTRSRRRSSTTIDRAWAANPNPGRISAVHRLNRAEYNNAIRDLFALDIDVTSLLPGDETADGSFDNFADVLSISTAHLERYLSVARQVTRLGDRSASGDSGASRRFEIPLHVLQDDRQSEDLPLGSRGGIAVRYDFPVDGEYLIKVRLQRQYQDYLKGMGWPQQLDVRLDGKLAEAVHGRRRSARAGRRRPAMPATASRALPAIPSGKSTCRSAAMPGWRSACRSTAGPHVVGVSFVREMWEPEGLPQPLQRGRVITNDQIYMDYANVGAVADRRAVRAVADPRRTRRAAARFSSVSRDATSEERACATKILSRIARLAYRRPVTAADVQTLLEFFDVTADDDGGSFDAGIQFALERMLVDPDFLLRVHRDPPVARGTAPAQSYPLSDLEVASRLSFFLWSSIPDERLLDCAERGQLTQARRARAAGAADAGRSARDDALVDNFAAQWLNLRRVGKWSSIRTLSELRRQPAAGLRAGDRAVSSASTLQRGSQRASIC